MKKQNQDSLKFDHELYAKNILEEVEVIENSIAQCKILTNKDLGRSTEGGTIKYYISNIDTVKIAATYYRETGKNEYAFYLKNNQLLLLKEQINEYSAPIFIEKKPKIVSSSVNLYFIENGKVKLLRNDDKNVFKSNYDKENQYVEETYMEFLRPSN